jgi:transcription factor TGA
LIIDSNSVFNSIKVSSRTISPGPVHTSTLPTSLDKGPSTNQTEPHRLQLTNLQSSNPGSGNILSVRTENQEEFAMADASPRTDISTDGDTDDKNQRVTYLKPLCFFFLSVQMITFQVPILHLHIGKPVQD